jgi:phospholipid/cholesterol/gamma-HCH transport system permease protein
MLKGATESILNGLKGFYNWVKFSGKVIYNFPQIFKYRGETYRQIFVLGNQALPLVILASVFISMALAIEWGNQLERFGAKSMIGGVLSNAVIREIGPLVVGLLMAARISAEMTSEIGNMVLTQQIDALRAFGTNPIKRLIVQRVFASLVVMAPLTIIADTTGIIAGWLASITWSGIDSQFFWLNALDVLLVKDLIFGIIKPTVYGFVIGLIGTYFGYTIQGGTEEMGRATSRAVIYASVSVLICDFIITKLMHSI